MTVDHDQYIVAGEVLLRTRVAECSRLCPSPGGPGLYDPCEKDPTDASMGLSNQEREDVTASAQGRDLFPTQTSAALEYFH